MKRTEPCFCEAESDEACECFCADCYDDSKQIGTRCVCPDCICEGTGDATGNGQPCPPDFPAS